MIKIICISLVVDNEKISYQIAGSNRSERENMSVTQRGARVRIIWDLQSLVKKSKFSTEPTLDLIITKQDTRRLIICIDYYGNNDEQLLIVRWIDEILERDNNNKSLCLYVSGESVCSRLMRDA